MKGWLAQKKVRLALLLGIGGLLAFGAIVLFGNGGGEKPEGTGTIWETFTSSAQEAAKDRPKRKAYPVGEWDTAIPYLNPFGSQNEYESVEFLPNQYHEFRYIDSHNREASSMTGGDVWRLQVGWTDEALDPMEDLMLYISELGGEFYRGSLDNRWVMHADDSEGTRWWGEAARNGGGYLLTVYKERKLRHGETVTFKTADYSNQEIYFVTANDQHKYQSLKVELAEGQAQVSGKGFYEQGQYRRDLSYSKNLFSYKTTSYALNDIPQDTSVPILWKITWRTDADPKEIAFTLDEGEPIQPFKDGERLGALKVRGSMLGVMKVQMSPGTVMTHPELSLRGDITPEGDTLFWLPPGYWNVVAEQKDSTANTASLNTRLIPVSSGEMTVVDIRPLVNNAYRNTEVGDSEGGESQLKLESVTEQGDQAKISFMLLDAQNPRFAPSQSDIEIVEGGQPGKIVKLERLQTAPSVVLALDSSGSMKETMGQVLASAKTFIQGLPENASIQLIDFDSGVRLLNGTTKEEALKSLGQVQAGGSTTLYDAVTRGLELLKEKQRATLVVFTDGMDSSAEKAGTGSKSTREAVLKAVEAAGIPLFTIGFGPDHDDATLLQLAAMSSGTYYSAKDSEALNQVFASINDRLGNRFEVTYERPKEQAPSDVPVISLTLDVSGSMDVDPASGQGDYRIDKVKRLFHEFIGQTPANSLTQLVSFSADVKVEQVFTGRKAELLQALGNLNAQTGTDIFTSARATYQSLQKIPSDKRVMVYVTDAALDVGQGQREMFAQLLAGIREEGIQALWVGLGTEENEEAFRWAAEQSGGKYVISEDPQVLAAAFEQALAEVQQKPAEKLALSLSVTNRSGNGTARQYTDSQLVDFPVRLNAGDKAALSTIAYETGQKVTQYEPASSSLVYGRDIPSEDVKIYKRIPLNVTGKNKAMEWTARELVFLKRLKGVDAPPNKSFAALDTELKNIHPEGVRYLIPDFASHFFFGLNEAGAYPASTATWLTETPVAMPGESAISIGVDETQRGMMVFVVPDETIRQASVHFYDTINGSVALPLVGEARKEEVPLASLPTSVTGKLSETFDMTIKAMSEQQKIESVELKRNTSLFKIMEAELKSNVQADLKLDPGQRFYLRIKTGSGPFLIPVHTATALLPYGLLRPVTLGPGSSNKARLAFQTPNALKDRPMELYVDLFGGGTALPVSGSGTDDAVQSGAPSFQGNGVKLTVSALARVNQIESGSGHYVVADLTIDDLPDGMGTSGFRETVKLVSEGSQTKPERQELYPDKVTDELLLGIDRDWAAFDGTSRRGLLVFAIPNDLADRTWTLQSAHFSDLKLQVGKEAYKEEGLLVKRISPELDDKFNIQLSAALTKAISEYKAMMAAMPAADTNAAKLADLDSGKGEKQSIPAPLPTAHGLVQLNSVQTWDDFQTLVSGLKWLPSSDPYYRYRHSPESVLTQGWGTEGDLANLAGGLLAKLGYSPSLRMVQVTDRGRQALQEWGGVDKADLKYLPAWAYDDGQGQSKVFVVPFMKDLSELSGLLFFPGGQERRSMTPVQSTVTVYYKVEPKGEQGLNAIAGDIAGALGGGEDDSGPQIQEVRVLDASLDLDQLGQEAVDIRVGGANGLYTAVLENQTLQIVGSRHVDPNQQNIVGVRIEVQLPDNKLVHETMLQEGEQISGVFHTLAVNLPDMTAEAAETLQQAADREYNAARRPDDRSTLAWYTRNIAYRFIANQTAFESELADTLDVTAGRTDKERVIVVTVRKKDAQSALRTSVDLQQSANMVHRGTGDAVRAFQLISGLYASRLEGAVLPGDQADFMELWTGSPEDTALFLSLQATRKQDLEYLQELGVPELLLRRAKESPKAMLIPTRSTRMYGENRWAWLEIDPTTYETIAVMDTGEHGSFAEYLMALEPVSPTGDDYLAFMAGGFIGISTSVWSVSSFALMLDNDDEIIKAAKLYTYGLGQVLSGMMDNKDLAKLEYSMSPLKLKLVDSEMDRLAKMYEKVEMGKDLKQAADVVGFTLGFQSGAAYYFKQMEKAKPAPKPRGGPSSNAK